MRPTPVATVVRYLLLDRVTYFVLPWTLAAGSFILDTVILQLTPAGDSHQRWVGGLSAVFVMMFAVGAQSSTRALPYALTLGVSRHSYLLGAAALAAGLGVSFGLVVAIGQSLERATGGWGIRMAYFRVPFLMDGSWYLTWLTAAIVLVVMFLYGLWYGLIFRRAGLVGTVAFGGAQFGVLAAAAVVTTWVHSWHSVGRFFGGLTATGVTGVLAVAVAALLAGTFGTIRRLTV